MWDASRNDTGSANQATPPPAPMLYHVSEVANIAHFVPRASMHGPVRLVWAVDQEHLRNYLLPRECPRVTFYATARTFEEDRSRFLRDAPAVVAIEKAWVDRLRATTLYQYQFPPDRFKCVDAGAGYYVSRTAVTPIRIDKLSSILEALAATGARLQVMESLWPLHDAVAASSLQFSMIRMRNAIPRAV